MAREETTSVPVSSVERKVLLASLVGSAIEWYDYFLYGTVAGLVFNKRFFPSEDPFVGLMIAYSAFALSFFMRPLGGILFSHFGDRHGRKRTLVLTLSLMGGATALMGVLPDYEAIGIWAPALLVALRLIQGLGLGGEWGGALLLAVEYAPKDRRGFFGSIPQIGVTIGMLLGTLSLSLLSLLPDEAFMSWGWRVPFLLSLALIAFGLWIRTGLDETPSFKKALGAGRTVRLPVVETFRRHGKAVLVTTGAKVVETAPFYLFSTFIVSYATGTLEMDRRAVLNAVSLATLVATVLIPLMGALSDRVGRRKLYVAGAVLLMLYAFPYFWLLDLRQGWALMLATVLGLGILWAPVTAVLGTLFAENFSTEVRYTGVSLGYQLGASLAGGTAPLIATALLRAFDQSSVPLAFYLMLTALISLVAVAFAREARGRELDG
ncbi:MFS transporter [Hydrogenibacillus sp. N12]|uniref:MFS transporter n=1 Tax=Hydrogenibacillus sp. N12 TaxID=2866627 RepID=UPI00207BDECC|nr:MFS transporter [Hydrogenibacillus sp. N12]